MTSLTCMKCGGKLVEIGKEITTLTVHTYECQVCHGIMKSTLPEDEIEEEDRSFVFR